MRKRGRARQASLARQRSVYCTALDWERIRALAEAAGVSVSRYLVECALEDEEPADVEAEGLFVYPLALSEHEQRTLYERIEALERFSLLMETKVPGTEVTVFEAIGLLNDGRDDWR